MIIPFQTTLGKPRKTDAFKSSRLVASPWWYIPLYSSRTSPLPTPLLLPQPFFKLEMRSTFFYILFGLAATSMGVPSGVQLAGQLLPKLLPKTEKRQVSAVGGIRSREIGGGFIAVLPQGNSILADGDGGSTTKRRFLRKDEVVVPDSLRGPSAKRAPSCADSRYGLCPSTGHCCPVGESFSSSPSFHLEPGGMVL